LIGFRYTVKIKFNGSYFNYCVGMVVQTGGFKIYYTVIIFDLSAILSELCHVICTTLL